LSKIEWSDAFLFVIKILYSTLNNIINLDGYQDELAIIVVSDCSTDNTDNIVTKFPHNSIKLIRTPDRFGKTKAENYALKYIDADIIIFSDVTTLFKNDIIKNVLPHFQNRAIGCVSTSDVIVPIHGEITDNQEGLYVKYEMFLRKLESNLGILTGASGSGYACRKELAIEIPTHLTRDLHIPLYGRQKKLYSISDSRAKCYIIEQKDIRLELNRKIRTFAGGIDTLLYMKKLLNPVKYGIFSWSLISHKLLRWMGGLFLLLLFPVSIILTFKHSMFGLILLTLQVVAYLYCYWRIFYGDFISNKYLNILFFFLLSNAAAAIAMMNCFMGKKYITWEPTKR